MGATREPSILSDFGEGYCRHCRFIEPLDAGGLLAEHFRGRHAGLYPLPCKGSGRLPASAAPYRSNLSAFRVTPRKVRCKVCGGSFPAAAGAIKPVRHNRRLGVIPAWSSDEPCPGGTLL